MTTPTPPPGDPPRPSERRALYVLTLVLGALALWTLRSLLAPVVVGAWFAGLAAPAIRRALGRSRASRPLAGVATAVLVVGMLLPLVLLAIPVSTLVADAVTGATRNGALLRLAETAAGATPAGRRAHFDWARLWEVARPFVANAAGAGVRMLGAVVAGFVQLATLVGSAYTFTAHGAEITAIARRGLPLAPAHFDALLAESARVARALFVGGMLTALAQGVCAWVVYLLLGIPDAALLAALTGVASLVPAVGTAVVWVPLCISLAAGGHVRSALILLACGLLVIGTIDNLLRPFLARVGARKLHPLLLFLGVMGGLATFGPWGLATGPLIAALFVAAFQLQADQRWRERTDPQG